MSGYNHERFINSFIERTQQNYKVITELNRENQTEVYEVTQLVNSLFGLLIIPYEKFKYGGTYQTKEEDLRNAAPIDYMRLNNKIEELKKDNRLVSTYSSDERYPVGNFIGHLRNALAHSGEEGLQFLPYDDTGEITSIYFYDKLDEKDKPNKRQFCAHIKIDEIKEIVEWISRMYIRHENGTVNPESYEQVKKQVEKYKTFLKQK